MSRRVRRAAAALVVLFPRAAAADPRPAGAEKVRVAYEAPSECPTRDVFLGQVRGRVGTDWEAPPDVLAHTIEVRVVSTPNRSVARIDFEEQGQRVSRTVTAATCEEVVSGIALVTALAIESRVTEALDKSEPASVESPGAAAPTPPVGGAPVSEPVPPSAPPVPPPATAVATNVTAPATPPAQGTEPRRVRAYHVDLGAAALARSGVGPRLAWGGRVFGGVGWRRGPDFRLGMEYTETPEAERSGAVTRFFLLGLRAAACPVAFGSGAPFRALPCVGLEAAAHHGESQSSAAIKGGSATLGSVAPFAAVRAEAVWGRLFAELELDARFPLRHPTFFFTNPPENVYTVNPVAFGISTGFGLRL